MHGLPSRLAAAAWVRSAESWSRGCSAPSHSSAGVAWSRAWHCRAASGEERRMGRAVGESAGYLRGQRACWGRVSSCRGCGETRLVVWSRPLAFEDSGFLVCLIAAVHPSTSSLPRFFSSCANTPTVYQTHEKTLAQRAATCLGKYAPQVDDAVVDVGDGVGAAGRGAAGRGRVDGGAALGAGSGRRRRLVLELLARVLHPAEASRVVCAFFCGVCAGGQVAVRWFSRGAWVVPWIGVV